MLYEGCCLEIAQSLQKQAIVQALMIPFVIQMESLRFHAREKKVVLLTKIYNLNMKQLKLKEH